MQYILAIDQGTSGTKTLIIDAQGKTCAKASMPLKTFYLDNGHVEQDAEAIYQNVLGSVQDCVLAFATAGFDINDIVTIGISNQRETFVVWNKAGKPLYNAVVWQCKRSVQICEHLKMQQLQDSIQHKTGLFIDPYFSATKMIWLYENNEQVKKAVDNKDAYFGTVDSWLLYKLTGGTKYATDYTNASRTMFFNLSTMNWDSELPERFQLANLQLPECTPSAHLFGETTIEGLLRRPVPIAAMMGDSHAAAFGESCFTTGMAKATMGTGCSILMNIGDRIQYSRNGMVTTICWSTADKVQYALEGVIVSCGATIEWLKNELGIIQDSRQTEAMAASVADNNGVYLIPAFSGLGAPHWDMNRKASITGLSFSAGKEHIVRAALESIPYQIKDVIDAMENDTQINLQQLMIDGGISANKFIVQFLADLLQKPVVNIGIADVSALGAAYMAGLQRGIFTDLQQLSQLQQATVTKATGNEKIKEWYQAWRSIITRA